MTRCLSEVAVRQTFSIVEYGMEMGTPGICNPRRGAPATLTRHHWSSLFNNGSNIDADGLRPLEGSLVSPHSKSNITC